MLLRLFLAALLCLPSAARADWSEAVSKHFVVYSEGPEWQVRQAAKDLEKYDYLLRLMTDAPDDSPVKVRIYLLGDVDQVRKMYGGGNVVGFYVDGTRAPIAVATRHATGTTKFDLSSQSVLFHEYAHHVMKQSFRAAFPTWYTEGFAEYYGTTRILPGNVIEIGRPADYRMASFRGKNAEWLPLDQILTASSYEQFGRRLHLLYAQGWLLVHYLANNEARRGQLGQFLLALNHGVAPRKAMDDAFGKDAAALNRELRAYSRKLKFNAIRLSFPSIETGPIQTRTLPRPEAALIKFDIALSRGILASYAGEFAAGVRKLAAAAPGSAFAAAILTEAEYAAGDHRAARDAAARWRAADPASARAMMFSGLIEAAALAKGGSKDPRAWAAARGMVREALKAAPSDPMILEAYYDSYTVQEMLPPAHAQNALYKAMELVPQDDRLRYKVAADFERRNLVEAAILAIRPSALRTHAPQDRDTKGEAERRRLMNLWRRAGDTRNETPIEMLARLERKISAGGVPGRQDSVAAAQSGVN